VTRARAAVLLVVLLGVASCEDARYDLGDTTIPTTAPRPITVPTTTTVVAPPTTHVLVAGDTLGAIAARFDTTVEVLMEANDLDDASGLLVGDVIVIPPPSTVPPGDAGDVR